MGVVLAAVRGAAAVVVAVDLVTAVIIRAVLAGSPTGNVTGPVDIRKRQCPGIATIVNALTESVDRLATSGLDW
jgi:hypothetical protein